MRRLVALTAVAASACTAYISGLDSQLPVPLEPANCPLTVTAPAPSSTWTRTGPWGAPVTALAAPGSGVVIAGTGFARGGAVFYARDAAIFRSTDRGQSFTRVRSLGDATVHQLLAVPGTQRVWAAVGSGSGAMDVGAWLSSDLGATFNPSNDGFPAGTRVLRLAPGAGSPSRVWALAQAGTNSAVTLYRKDGDAPWTALAATGVDANPGGPMSGLAADPSARDRVWVVDGARLYRSDDGGAQFQVVAGGAVLYGPTSLGAPAALFVDPADASHLIIATRDEALLESRDGAASWAQRRPEGDVSPFGVSDVAFTSDGALAATSGVGLQRVRTDAWAREGGCLLDGVVLALAQGDDGAIYAGTSGGLSRSDDGAKNFASVGEGLESVLARVYVTGSGDAATAWLASSAGVFRFDRAASSWNRVGDWGGALAVADVAFAPDGARAWLAIDEALFPGRYGVGDGVLEWDLTAKAVVRPALPSTAGGIGAVVAGASGAWAYSRGDADVTPPVPAQVWRAGADGRWSPTTLTGAALTDTVQFRFAPLAAASDGALYAGVRLASGAPALMRSDDGGGAWAQVWTQTGWVPHAVGVAPDGAVYLAGAYGSVGVRRSTDRGQSFAPWDDGLPALSKIVYALGFAPDGTVLAGTQSGVFARAPSGTFTELTGFTTAPAVWSVAVLPDSAGPIAIAATDRGVFWRRMP
jgi:hypothetical protein